jgi:hypothetical protein
MWNISRRLIITTVVLHLLNPPHRTIERLNTGYEKHKTKKKHPLLYMDDLKLLGKSEEEIQKQIQRVTIFNDDIRMEFGLDKCVNIVF